ncbi:MAG: hypothetical protein K0R38_5660 [Polyangiaceae bacterium]|jgi:hypothetical protein|nr:hypothetical protein [Polyangiaceae bacterium]
MSDRDDPKTAPLVTQDPSALPVREEELPVVARIIVEVRSDGMRTIARGAMEDAASNTRVAIEASGASPLELATALAKSIFAAPWLPKRAPLSALRGLLKKRG